MYQTINWKEQISIIAGPKMDGDNLKSLQARAAKRANISFRMAQALYEGTSANPSFETGVKVLAAAEKARKEASQMASRFENLAGVLNAKDADVFGGDVLALIEAARRLRSLSRA
jgi:hypothetical protein